MKSLADELPPEFAAALHPDWRKNEAGYWAERDALVKDYGGQWVAYSDGAVIAHGPSPVDVLHAGVGSGRHPFVTCVGHEDQPTRIRRASFGYDASYPVEPLPVLSAEFRSTSGSAGVTLDRVIPDTGADATVLPWSDCQLLSLDPSAGVPGRIGGIGGGSAVTLTFRIWVWLDGTEYPCRVQADLRGRERILGRDILNRLEILFRGPAGEVVVNP
jgi:hypothetical protein